MHGQGLADAGLAVRIKAWSSIKKSTSMDWAASTMACLSAASKRPSLCPDEDHWTMPQCFVSWQVYPAAVTLAQTVMNEMSCKRVLGASQNWTRHHSYTTPRIR